jgi:hypothetical protein
MKSCSNASCDLVSQYKLANVKPVGHRERAELWEVERLKLTTPKPIHESGYLPLIHLTFDPFEGEVDGQVKNAVYIEGNLWMHGYDELEARRRHDHMNVLLRYWKFDFPLHEMHHP